VFLESPDFEEIGARVEGRRIFRCSATSSIVISWSMLGFSRAEGGEGMTSNYRIDRGLRTS
jgi:hypothetical protein